MESSILEELRKESGGEDLDLSWLDKPAAERGLRVAPSRRGLTLEDIDQAVSPGAFVTTMTDVVGYGPFGECGGVGRACVRREVLIPPRGCLAKQFAASSGPGFFLEYYALCLSGPRAPRI